MRRAKAVVLSPEFGVVMDAAVCSACWIGVSSPQNVYGARYYWATGRVIYCLLESLASEIIPLNWWKSMKGLQPYNYKNKTSKWRCRFLWVMKISVKCILLKFIWLLSILPKPVSLIEGVDTATCLNIWYEWPFTCLREGLEVWVSDC